MPRRKFRTVNNELPLEGDNPSPFVRPFLVLVFGKKGKDGYEARSRWLIDVNGQIENYLVGESPRKGSHIDLSQNATKLLKSMIAAFAEIGLETVYVSTYEGIAGPHLVLRNGALFLRINLEELKARN
jgi:hypothetical protein